MMGAVQFKNLEELKKMEGCPLPRGEWVRLTQEMIDDFASATHDDQWIHTDPVRAKTESPLGTTVAHGFLSLSLVSAMIGDVARLPSAKMAVNYGLNRVRFPSPVPVNSRLRLNCRVGQVEKMENKGVKVVWACEVEMESSDRPACVCELISVIFE